MRAGQYVTIETGKDLSAGVGGSFALTTEKNGDIKIGGMLKTFASSINLQSSGDTSLLAGGIQARDGSNIFDNSGKATAASPSEALVANSKSFLDTAKENGAWTFGANKINTIVSRMPTHEPWHGHPNSKIPPPPTNPNAIPNSNGTAGGATNPTISGCGFGVAGLNQHQLAVIMPSRPLPIKLVFRFRRCWLLLIKNYLLILMLRLKAVYSKRTISIYRWNVEWHGSTIRQSIRSIPR